MAINPDPLFGIHPQSLSVWAKRAEVIAGNLANADTPHYHARDIDFRQVLARAGSAESAMPLAATSGAHLQAGSADGSDPSLRYRVPTQPSMDGNTVDTQIEQAAYAENSVRYQASLTFLNGQVRMLRMAITGAA